MSSAEVDRFVNDLQGNAALRDAVGKAAGVSEIVNIATRHGYGCTLDEMRHFIKAKVRASENDLTDQELDHIVGGTTPAQHDILVAILGR